MNLETIETKIKNHQIQAEGFKRPAAVMVLLMEKADGLYVVLTMRALCMKAQPGDICFPGGRMEKGEDATICALREVKEELGIASQHITIIKEIDFITTPYGAYVVPIVAKLEGIDETAFKINPEEVEKVILLPLNYLMTYDPKVYWIHLKQEFSEDFPFEDIHNGKNYKWASADNKQLFYYYEDIVIWGLTARILDNVKMIINEE